MGGATVSFGLISIPVKIYPASQSAAGISFHMLHARCHTRLKQQYVCPAEGNEVVPRAGIVKGYEFAKDRHVVLTEEELQGLQTASTETIEITEFVTAKSVDPVYFDRAYYLGPDKGGEKAYRLLSEALRETRRTALAKYAARGKQYLVMLRPVEKRLVMQTLRYANEVRDFADVPMPDADVKPAELKLAVELIGRSAAETFRPEDYVDEVEKRMEALIARKVEGKPAEPEVTPERKPIVDLMEALQASLGMGGQGERSTGEARSRMPAEKVKSAGATSGKPARRPGRRADATPRRPSTRTTKARKKDA